MPSLTTSQKVAIAVTFPVAAVVVYLLLKWSRDDTEQIDDFGNENQSGGSSFASSSDNILEVRIPQSLVGAIIGRGGCNIKAIQKDSQTRINLKDDVEESDGEDMSDESKINKMKTRVLVIRGSRERAKNAEILIRKVVAEQPILERTTMNIPQRVIGRIIGKGGKTIRQLCRISGARIKIDRDMEAPGDVQICEIVGTQAQIVYAKQLVDEKINEDNAFKTREKQANEDKVIKDNLCFVTLPTDEDYFGVYVSAMENPGRFWMQVVTKDSKQLDDLVEEMTVYYGDNGEGCLLKEPKIGDVCCSPFQHDRSWYRCRITDIVPPDVHVDYLDFGDNGRVPLSNAKELRMEYYQLPFQAIECHLANIKPKEGEWSKKACDIFEKLSCCAQWKVLMACVVSLNNHVAAIELFDTNGDQDVNIEEELVKQDCALYINASSTDQNEGPRTLSNPASSEVDEELIITDEQLITSHKMAEQDFQFSAESQEMDSFNSFVFEEADSRALPPDDARAPVNEPAVAAVEQTVVSCVDISQLPTLLDFEGTEGDFEGYMGDSVTSWGPPILDESPVTLEEKNVAYDGVDPLNKPVSADEYMASPSGSFAPREISSIENCDNHELGNLAQITRENLADELSEPVINEHFTSDAQLETYSEMSPIMKTDTNEQPDSLDSDLERSVPDVSDDMLIGNQSSEVVESGLNSGEKKDEEDGRRKSQHSHVLKGGKRLLAANFSQLANSNTREDEDEDEDDDSLYLSAKEEDNDSTGFVSATGSTLDLCTSDSESDVTPSGYLSDTDEEWSGIGNEMMSNQTKLDNTLLAETLEQIADK